MSDVLPMDIGVECFDDEEYGGGEGDRGGGRELGQGKDENLEEEETEKSTDVAQAGVTAGEAQLETKASVENEEGGWLDVVLPRLTKLPAVTTRVFRCADPHQRGITVELFEGVCGGGGGKLLVYHLFVYFTPVPSFCLSFLFAFFEKFKCYPHVLVLTLQFFQLLQLTLLLHLFYFLVLIPA